MANLASLDQIPSVCGGGGGGFLDTPQAYGLDMLAFHDYGGASLFDMLQQPTPPQSLMVKSAPQASTMLETSEVVNTPPTNSSSLSSSSNEPVNDVDQENNTRSDDDQEKNANKQLKPKKKNQKKQKGPRFAFMTKTEVDHLDDGYRWRKYGQKAVKNSPFPRSYYRCTSASCGVKKRVERLTEDPAVVVTTYEGIHIHPCPVTPRGMLPETATYGGLGGGGGSSYILPPFHYQQPLRPFFHNQTNSLSFNNTTTPSSYSHYLQERQFCPPSMTSSLHRDQGLLQDMVSFQIRKEEPKVEPS
ncbi:probable WRKY transcription factor 48 [Lactuca sativa]|uniref:WRKY domain-containing protein n=1 Tax=Lactuca sativa TaxID=4236 RepID=A0A9R1XAH1_LACSA|nr:probable WRKY transcription factor 48 [Lactuca sativa]KAJ0201437.1 hypothetical protein LSAT_V11C600341900 [Lactuca sativa]